MEKCPDCGKNKKLRAKRCPRCSYINLKEKMKVKSQSQREKIYLTCEICKENFETERKTDKYCGTPCKEIAHNNAINERWLKRDLKNAPRKDGDKIEYARVRERKNQGWLKKFTHVRG